MKLCKIKPIVVNGWWDFINEKCYECDVCHKKVFDNGEMLIGGNQFKGFYHLTKENQSTMLDDLQEKRNWDFCSVKCLKEFINNIKE